MGIKVKSEHITPADGNVFNDLGFEPEAATALYAESQRVIAEKLSSKNKVEKANSEGLEPRET